MQGFFYRLLIALSKLSGMWLFRAIACWIALGYFIFFPKRTAAGIRFYRALFPSRGRLHHIRCVWNQYQSFTHVYADGLLLSDNAAFACSHEGWRYLEEAVGKNRGGVVLMSHAGNWEIAARLLMQMSRNNPQMKMLLYMGRKPKEQIEKAQKESLLRSGVRITAVDEDGGSPVDILDGLNFLKAGGLVSLTGDRLWRKDQRAVCVRFLEHEAFLPQIPFILAAMAKAPLLILFAFRTGEKQYHFQIMPPLYIETTDRTGRPEAIGKAAQAYAALLEEKVRQYPFQWYHFGSFLSKRKDCN